MTLPEGLFAGSGATSGLAATVAAGGAATAPATSAVLPGTASPAMVAAAARASEHGLNRLAASQLGAAVVAEVAAAYAAVGISYEVTDAGNAAALVV